jgi:hypothetical protein
MLEQEKDDEEEETKEEDSGRDSTVPLSLLPVRGFDILDLPSKPVAIVSAYEPVLESIHPS